MKFVKWKTLTITSLVCLLPIFLGLALWYKLPQTMAIHFDINNNPDNFAPKAFVVFGLPLVMVFLQIICCIANDFTAQKNHIPKLLEHFTKWIIPVVTVILHLVTLAYGLGYKSDIRRIAMMIVGIMLIVTGCCLPKLDYVKNYKVDKEKARKINGFMGIGTIIIGILGLITIFFEPIATLIWLLLMIPFGIISALYAIIILRKKG